jgi:hypothetical protein
MGSDSNVENDKHFCNALILLSFEYGGIPMFRHKSTAGTRVNFLSRIPSSKPRMIVTKKYSDESIGPPGNQLPLLG